MREQENKLISDASRRNRYSIRKFTVGAASIVVGATVLFGLGGEARAAETSATPSNETATDSASNATSTSNTTDPAQSTAETATNTTPDSTNTSNESTTTDTTNTSSSQHDTTTTNDNSASSTTATPTQDSSAQDKPTTGSSNATEPNTVDTQTTPTQDKTTSATPTQQDTSNTASTPKTDTTQSASEQAAPKATTDTTTPASEAPSQSSTNKATSQSNEAPTNPNTAASNSATTQEPSTSSVNEPNSLQGSTTSTDTTAPTTAPVTETQTLTAADTTTPQANDTLASTTNTGLSNNPEVQQLAAQAGVQATDSPEVAMAKMLQQSSSNKDANTIQATTAQPAATRRMMAYNAVAPQSTAANTTTAQAAPATTTLASPSQGATAPIAADAIANGYIKSQTDATNAANTLSGRAWVVDEGTPATMANGLTPVPEGTDVYMQWIDTDGAVSPVYTAKTSNQLSSSDGSQVGPGAYAFDLREGWTDLNGKTHKYNATGGQDYRLWINDYKTVNGNTATMLRQAGGFYPGSYVDSVTNSNLGQFPLIGTNMQRTGIYMAVKPTSGYMENTQANQIHDTAGPISAPSVNTNAKNTVSGNVWLETGAGDYANSATGPNDNAKDPQAAGYTVVMSSLTTDGAKAYDTAVNSLPQNERAAAAKTLLEAHPEYISATVYGETDKDGKYTLRFPTGTLDTSHMYGYVKDPNGTIVNTYSSFTSPQFRAPNYNSSWTPQLVPGQNLVMNPMWYNVNFAVVPTADLTIDVLNYDSTTTPAAPGSNVDIALPGTTISPLPTHIEWRDSKGNVLVTTPDFTTASEGEQLGKFQVPTDAQPGSIYTAYLVSGGNDVSADSFIVQTYTQAYDPESTGVTNPYNTPTTENQVVGNVTVPNYPANQTPPTIKVDDPSTLPDGKTPGTVNVPVTVTYPDGTTDNITVPVTTATPLSDAYEPTAIPVNNPNGTKTTENQVIDNVAVPNYPTDQTPPTITVDNPTTLPDGTTPGTVDVPVTVTYPDGSQDKTVVNVTTANPQADIYDPTTNPIENNAGVATTENDVTSHVTIPNYPVDQPLPKVTVDNPTTLPDGSVPGTVDVPATVTYPDGSVDHVNVPVTTRPAAPAINPSEAGSTTVSGTGYPSGNITVYLPDGTTQNTQTNPDGTWSVESKTPLNANDVISAFQTVGTNNSGQPNESDLSESTVVDHTVPDTTAPDAPPINPIESGSTTITGTGEPNSTITVTYPNGSTSDATVGQDGTWTTDVPTGTTLKDGDSVTATATDEAGNTSEPSTQTVTDTVAPDAPPINPTEAGSTTVTGIGNPGDTIKVTYPDGSTSETTVNPDGNWTTDVPTGTTLKDGDRITATATDESNNTSTPSTGVVTDTTAPDAPPINPVEAGSTTVTGTGNPGDTITVTFPDGNTTTGTVNPNGSWAVDVPTGTTLNHGDKVTATATDEANNTSTESSVTVTDTVAPDAPPINPVEAGSTTVTGTGNPGDTITVTFPDGNTTTGTVNPDGSWAVDVPTGTTLNHGDKVTATATDEANNTSTESSVTVTDTTAPEAPIINGVKDGATTVTGTGNPGDTITVTFPDGNTTTGTVNPNGSWAVDVPTGTTVKKGDIISATATDDANNTSESSTVTVTGDNVTTPDAPVINPVDKTDNAVTGTGTPGNEVTVTFPDGTTVKTPVKEDGTWTTDVPEEVHLQDGDVITAVETDKDGNTSESTSITVTGKDNHVTPPANNDNQGDSTVVTPEPPVINEVPTNSPSVTGTGTPGHQVEVTFPDGHVEVTTVNPQGSWSVPVSDGETLESGEVITAVEIDEAGNPSEVVRAIVGNQNGSDNQDNALPDTGETDNTNNATLFGGLFAALGSILLFGKRRKDNKDKQ